jgi:hypothetical protein
MLPVKTRTVLVDSIYQKTAISQRGAWAEQSLVL